MDGQTVGQLGTGGKGWEQGGNNKRKNNNLAGINYYSKRQNSASDNYKGT